MNKKGIINIFIKLIIIVVLVGVLILLVPPLRELFLELIQWITNTGQPDAPLLIDPTVAT